MTRLSPSLPEEGPERVMCCLLYGYYLDQGQSFDDARYNAIQAARLGRWYVEAGLDTWEHMLGVKKGIG